MSAAAAAEQTSRAIAASQTPAQPGPLRLFWYARVRPAAAAMLSSGSTGSRNLTCRSQQREKDSEHSSHRASFLHASILACQRRSALATCSPQIGMNLEP